MSRRTKKGGQAAQGVNPLYEGPEVLTALLHRAGSPHGVDEVAAAFRRAQQAGEPRAEVIPGLFPDEPRFGSPDEARRLYANLFGLWVRLEAGLGTEDDDAPAAAPAELPPPPPLPGRGTAIGRQLTPDLVDAVWRHLAALPERELGRRRDRFMSVQSDLSAWLDAVPLPAAGGLAAADLVFEAWAMFDQGFGDRLGAVAFHDLKALEREPPPLEASQPAFALYADEQLDVVQDEDPDFGDPERAQVERAVAAAVAALGEMVRGGE
jgi:hypothetical protein